MSGIRSVVTEDWERDAVRVVLVDHDSNQVSMVELDDHAPTPLLRMVPFRTWTDLPDDDQAGILLPSVVARELYDALGRHFGIQPEPASRELVDVLKDIQAREAERVDHLIGAMTPPRRWVPGTTTEAQP